MLGFRSSKCKTACRLCISRIKLNRNKREIQLTQQRRQIAQLLAGGKNEYAWIRIEAIIRERNLLAAYEILELYLELISVRVELIEKHKTCPRDMIEAITTIMFATPRVADLPELVDVRKWLNVKYGRELGVEGGRTFDGEEPPAWQVNVRLRQLLSVEAPEAEEKLSMISNIAKEPLPDFDMKAFAESVMVTMDQFHPPPPIPKAPVALPDLAPSPQQQPQVYGVLPQSRITTGAPNTFEPGSDAPVPSLARPSVRVDQNSTYGDQNPETTETPGQSTPVDASESLIFPSVPQTHIQSSFSTLQQQYDDIPSPPNKEEFHDEEEEEDVQPTAPPADQETELDNDLSRRLAELRKR